MPASDHTYTQSARLTGFLGWGDGERPTDDDPAEAFHEASKNIPSVLPQVSSAAASLTADPTAGVPGATAARATRRNLALPTIDLPPPSYPEADLGEQIRGRRSRRAFGGGPLAVHDLATLLHAAYGVIDPSGADPVPHSNLRSVPSAGGLYPLEIFVVARNLESVVPGLYHYDPFRHLLEVIRREEVEATLRELLIDLPQLRDIPATCGALFFVSAAFWRTRFKYGLRGYRWVLVEAGHVGQNMLLTANSLGLSAYPNAGFWDRRVDDFLGLDGVNESVVYSLVAGTRG